MTNVFGNLISFLDYSNFLDTVQRLKFSNQNLLLVQSKKSWNSQNEIGNSKF